MNNPAQRAEEMRSAYRSYVLGNKDPAAKHVYHRFEATDNRDTFIGFRGPYLQALDVPNWSDRSWEEFATDVGIHYLIRDAFSALGFERLYDFQERAVETVKQGDDTLITAATGRGKTEGWLIPILDYILRAKEGEVSDCDPQSVKALLVYPTKALAQDQLKRLIEYLYKINRELPPRKRITIGIYDGDTPTHTGMTGAEGYLRSSFKFFDCPGYNEDLQKCRGCSKNLRITPDPGRFTVKPTKQQCETDVPLEFIHLTKQDILENDVDIILTNPDIINLRAMNINAPAEQETFIYEPDFLVFDEVHTYTGLFGSYTSMLVKRLRALRQARGESDLQVVAGSATVNNHDELFRKVAGVEEISHVPERPSTLPETKPDELPGTLSNTEIGAEQLVEMGRNPGATPPAFDREFVVDGYENLSRTELADTVSNHLFDYLTTNDNADTVVQTVQYVHRLLHDNPRTREELLAELESEFDVTREQATQTLSNVRTVGEFSGLLENRSHLFSWPLDGFYACLRCDAVYRSPQGRCTECGHTFVTRSTYCNHGGEESLVAWYCPACEQLEPYTPTEHGGRREDEHNCQRCSARSGEIIESFRVTFRPWLECQECQYVGRRTTLTACKECGSPTTRTAPDTAVCTNPACEREHNVSYGCEVCGSTALEPRTFSDTVDCPDCGERLRIDDGQVACDCGETVTNTHLLPWVCRNDDCERLHFDHRPPDTCECGSYTFARGGLFELTRRRNCGNCGETVVPGFDCGCDDPDLVDQTVDVDDFGTFDTTGSRRSPSDFRTGVPCYHPGTSYGLGRYDELKYSYNNLAVTTAQYLLRSVAEDEGFDAAKMLSFADAHSDMKELRRDFDEPEVETVLDQLVLSEVFDEGGWVPFETVLDGAFETIAQLEAEFSSTRDVPEGIVSLLDKLKGQARRNWETERAVRDRLRRRTIPHRYSSRYREYDGPMSKAGVLDVRLDSSVDLSEEERAVVRPLVTKGNRLHIDTVRDASGLERPTPVLQGLAGGGVIELSEDEEWVSLSPSALEVTGAGDSDGLWYDPDDAETHSTLERRFGQVPASAVPYDTSLEEAATPDHPRFSYRAFRTTYSSPMLLWAREYLGLTDKQERRNIEYLFKEGKHPHFLSSGPTMEVGVDIGSLDSLLLFGTPPNMNAYLQRVGRAGRSSKSALVHSVSQRNPIDYYYYENPVDLIDTSPKDVPLNEHNEEVLRVSLSWAVFDYVAATFGIDWRLEHQGNRSVIQGGDHFEKHPDEESVRDWCKFTAIREQTNDALQLNTRRPKIQVLEELVHDNADDIADHLRSLLDYHYCELCGLKYSEDHAGDRCHGADCDGRIRHAGTTHGELVADAVESFPDRYIHHYFEYTADLLDTQDDLYETRRDLERERRSTRDDDRAEELRRQIQQLRSQEQVIDDHLEDVQSQKYSEFLRTSRQSKYAFNMRSISTSVGATLVTEDYEREPLADDRGRDARMAIRELHPGAAYLHDNDVYVVARTEYDEFEGAEIRQRIDEVGADEQLAQELVCPVCHATYPLDTEFCDQCQTEVSLKPRTLAVLDSVTAYRSDLSPSVEDSFTARELYRDPDAEVQSTYAERERSILSFDPIDEFTIETADGEQVGRIVYGDLDVLVHATGFQASYQTGAVDGRETLFERCGHDECPGIVVRDEEENEARCTVDAGHDPDGFEHPSEFVRLGYSYSTTGVRVELDGDDGSAVHALTHGFRVALQYLGGVDVRALTEVVDEDLLYLFDSQEGGAQITRLLVDTDDGQFRNFEEALSLITEHFECDCDDGCPLCVFQYGCDTYNDPGTLARDRVQELLGTDPQLSENE